MKRCQESKVKRRETYLSKRNRKSVNANKTTLLEVDKNFDELILLIKTRKLQNENLNKNCI